MSYSRSDFTDNYITLEMYNPSPNDVSTSSFDDLVVTAAIPEPASFLLLGTGILGLGLLRKRFSVHY